MSLTSHQAIQHHHPFDRNFRHSASDRQITEGHLGNFSDVTVARQQTGESSQRPQQTVNCAIGLTFWTSVSMKISALYAEFEIIECFVLYNWGAPGAKKKVMFLGDFMLKMGNFLLEYGDYVVR